MQSKTSSDAIHHATPNFIDMTLTSSADSCDVVDGTITSENVGVVATPVADLTQSSPLPTDRTKVWGDNRSQRRPTVSPMLILINLRSSKETAEADGEIHIDGRHVTIT